MSKVLSVRVSDEVARRVEKIARGRGVKSPSVVKAAVEGYLDDCGRGLPDAPREVAPAEPVSAVASLDVAAIRAKAAAAARGGS